MIDFVLMKVNNMVNQPCLIQGVVEATLEP